jgi:hypothetical protein
MIAFDNSAYVAATTGYPTSITYSLTVGSGNNRILIVSVQFWGGSSSTFGVTFNGVALSQAVFFVSSVYGCGIWYLINPPTGTYNIVVDNSVSLCITVGSCATCYSGVEQTSPIDVTQSGTREYPASATLTLTATASLSGEWGIIASTANGSITANTNATQRVNSGTSYAEFLGDTNSTISAGSYSMATSDGNYGSLRSVMVFIKPALSIPTVDTYHPNIEKPFNVKFDVVSY